MLSEIVGPEVVDFLDGGLTRFGGAVLGLPSQLPVLAVVHPWSEDCMGDTSIAIGTTSIEDDDRNPLPDSGVEHGVCTTTAEMFEVDSIGARQSAQLIEQVPARLVLAGRYIVIEG